MGVQFQNLSGQLFGIAGRVMKPGPAMLHEFGQTARGGGQHRFAKIISLITDIRQRIPPDGWHNGTARMPDQFIFCLSADVSAIFNQRIFRRRRLHPVGERAIAADDEARRFVRLQPA